MNEEKVETYGTLYTLDESSNEYVPLADITEIPDLETDQSIEDVQIFDPIQTGDGELTMDLVSCDEADKEENQEVNGVNEMYSVYPIIQNTVDTLVSGLNKIASSVKAVASGIFDMFAKALTNKRVRHLYKYGKGRVKTKNKNRIGQAIGKLTKPFREKKKIRKRKTKSFMVIDDLGGEYATSQNSREI